jgi:hypothetical protein
MLLIIGCFVIMACEQYRYGKQQGISQTLDYLRDQGAIQFADDE